MPTAPRHVAASRRASSVRRLVAVCVVAVGGGGVAYGATSWLVGIGTTRALATSQPLGPPSGVTATCAAPATARTVTVTWTAVPHATYTVYQATAVGGPYTAVATGVATTSWTSAGLKSNTYYFKVSATVTATWTSAQSAASAGRTMNNKAPFCV